MRAQLGGRLPAFTDADFALLRAAETDFYGMNYYTSQFARHRDGPARETDYVGNLDELQQNKSGTPVGEESGLGWLRSCPGMFRKHLTRVHRLYGKPIYITENGCPCPGEDQMTRDEAIDDPFRIRYFDSHLDAIGKAIQEDGSEIKGYFAWALLDNLGKRCPPPFNLHVSLLTVAVRMVRRVWSALRRDVYRLQHSGADAQEVGSPVEGHVC